MHAHTQARVCTCIHVCAPAHLLSVSHPFIPSPPSSPPSLQAFVPRADAGLLFSPFLCHLSSLLEKRARNGTLKHSSTRLTIQSPQAHGPSGAPAPPAGSAPGIPDASPGCTGSRRAHWPWCRDLIGRQTALGSLSCFSTTKWTATKVARPTPTPPGRTQKGKK